MNGVGVLIHMTAQQASNVLVFLNRTQLQGAEALELVLCKQVIERALAEYRSRDAEPEPEATATNNAKKEKVAS